MKNWPIQENDEININQKKLRNKTQQNAEKKEEEPEDAEKILYPKLSEQENRKKIVVNSDGELDSDHLSSTVF
jgi:hypothetical protein